MTGLRIALVLWLAAAPAAAQVRTASLGRCDLERGAVIDDCTLAYRTFGTLTADRRNTILVPTWFGGSLDAARVLLGADTTSAIDTTAFFVVVVQSLGSAPSSSPGPRNDVDFPVVDVEDMVRAAYRLVHDELQLPSLHAVVGISLGGVQAFEWGAAHPEYVHRVVAAGATTRLSAYSQAFWELIAATAEEGADGRVSRAESLGSIARLLILGLSTPESVNRRAPSDYRSRLASQVRDLEGIDLREWALTARAGLRYDLARRTDGDIAKVAETWRPATLVISAAQDHMVGPQPSLEFARLVQADTLVLPGRGGHTTVFASPPVNAAIRRFLTAER